MLVCATTGVWGDWHLRQFFEFALPTLLSEGNLPALVKDHRVEYSIVTSAADASRFRSSSLLDQLADLVDLRVSYLSPREIDEPIATHHRVWREGIRRATRKGAMCLFLPPDVVWADGSVAGLSRVLSEGKRAVFNTYLRVVSESFPKAIVPMHRAADGSVRIPPRRLVEVGFKHVHPLMSCFLVDGAHMPKHIDLLMWGVPGQGLSIRLLGRELLCFDPRRFRLNAQAMLDEVTCTDELHLFTDSDDFFALSLTPMWKDHEWYATERGFDPIQAAAWWLAYDSPVNSWLWRQPIRYHTSELLEEEWLPVEISSWKQIEYVERLRELFRIYGALRAAGFDRFASALGVAAAAGGLADLWNPMERSTLLVPTNAAFEDGAQPGSRSTPEVIAEFVHRHRKVGEADFVAPWRSRGLPADPRRQMSVGTAGLCEGAGLEVDSVAYPPRAGRASLAGYGFRVGETVVYPIDRILD